MGQRGPLARSDDDDLGRPLDRRPIGGRPDRADDPDLLALGRGAHPHPVDGPPRAAARLADSARALAIYGRDGRARLHRVQRPLLRRRASNERPQSVDHPGRDTGAGAHRRAAFSGRPVHRAAGARRLDDHGRRRGDRRSGRAQPAHGVRVQRRRRDDVHRRGSLRRLYDRVARAAKGFGLEPARRHGAGGFRHLRAADDLGDRRRADSSGRPRRDTRRSSMSRSARPSSRRSCSCAGSS